MKVRKAILEDVGHILNLFRQFPAEEIDLDWEACGPTLGRVICDPQLGSVFVSDENGRLLGVITLSFPVAIRFNGHYCCIEEFIVSKEARGKGVGGRLLQAALQEAETRGCREVQVNNPSESGYPLYLKNGFEDIGRHLALRMKP